MNASDPLSMLETLIQTGLKDQNLGWQLAYALTADFPQDPRIVVLQTSIVDLLVAIELEVILGGAIFHHQERLHALLAWVTKYRRERTA